VDAPNVAETAPVIVGATCCALTTAVAAPTVALTAAVNVGGTCCAETAAVAAPSVPETAAVNVVVAAATMIRRDTRDGRNRRRLPVSDSKYSSRISAALSARE
jgi:hypothetical protein